MKKGLFKKRFVYLFLFFGVIGISFLFLDIQTHAGIEDTLGIQEQINISATPANPAPGALVTIKIEAYGTNLNQASMVWKIDGKEFKKGTGITSIETNAGQNGEYKSVTVDVTTTDGSLVQKNVTVSSQEVDILWEGQGITPPYYKGKTLYVQQGGVTLVAMPNMFDVNGKIIDPATMTYKWKVNNKVLGSKSGYGKNSLVYEGTILLKDTRIDVEVTTPDGTQSKNIILLSPQSSDVVMYENSPLYGVLYNKALVQNFNLKNKEVIVEAHPYNLTVSDNNSSDLEYVWSINGSNISTPATQNFAVFRNTTGKQGNSRVSVEVANNNALFQRASTNALINF